MKRALLIFIYCTTTVLLSSQTVTNLYEKTDKRGMRQWVDSLYATMSVDEKIGQLFMPIAEPNSGWKSNISGYIKNQKIGGLLFSKGDLKSQAEITNWAQKLTKVPLLISTDGEWGLAMRLTDAPEFPRNRIVGAIEDKEIIRLYGKEVARQCREMGIHINFAPVLDVHSNPNNPVIGSRSFGENPENVAKCGIAFAMGLEENGIMAVAKHFPGHGDTSVDSHKALPTVAHDRSRLEQVELFPFKEWIDSGLSGLMTGHINVPELQTNGLPASLSQEVGVKLLCEEMGFTGLTFTDGMAMKAVSTVPDAAVKALLAGNDIILGVTNLAGEFSSVKKAVENGTIEAAVLEKKVKKILAYKYILTAHKFEPIDSETVVERVNSASAECIQRKIYDGAVTLIKNHNSEVPLKQLNSTKITSIAVGTEESNIFQQYLKKYANISTFQVESTTDIEAAMDLKEQDLTIISLHSDKAVEAATLGKAIGAKATILVLFIPPQRLNYYQSAIDSADVVIAAYDNSRFAQMSAAQAIFGGISMSGRLPLSSEQFTEGSGIDSKKSRLGYSLPEEVGISSESLRKIEDIVMEGIEERAYPGCQILVAKDGVVIYEREFGELDYAGSLKVTQETVYDLASVTKASATVPAIMKLYDDKLIGLQDRLDKFVTETKGSDKGEIRIKSLLLHETGIKPFIPYYVTAIDTSSYKGTLFGRQSNIYNLRYAGAWGRGDWKFYPEMISNELTEEHYMPVAAKLYASENMHQALLKEVVDSDIKNRGRYRYSCLNFILLKEAVENIAETDLNSFLHKNIFDRLGSTTTTFLPLNYMDIERIAPTENDPFFRKQHLRGYVHDEGAALFGGISGNAGLFSNANDLAKLYQMLLNKGEYGDERILSEETVKLFTATKSSVSRRGLGFDKPDPKQNDNGTASPSTPISAYGHHGYTGTCFWIDPENNMIYIFLSNRVNPSRSPDRLSSLKIKGRIQEELYKALKIREQNATDSKKQ